MIEDGVNSREPEVTGEALHRLPWPLHENEGELGVGKRSSRGDSRRGLCGVGSQMSP